MQKLGRERNFSRKYESNYSEPPENGLVVQGKR